MNIPQLIRLASSTTVYANQSLIQFIRQSMSQASDEVKSGDNIFFMKNTTFKRDLLTVAKDPYQRVIKLSKANCMIINTNMALPQHAIGMKDKVISNMIDTVTADDIVFNISQYGSDYVDLCVQWLEFYQLSNKPRLVHESKILEYVNSGIIINEDNIDQVLDLINSDVEIAARMIDNCDIANSFLYILYIIYFVRGFQTKYEQVAYKLKNVTNYLNVKNCRNVVPESIFKEMMKIPFLRDKISNTAAKMIKETLMRSIPQNMSSLIKDPNVDFAWKE